MTSTLQIFGIISAWFSVLCFYNSEITYLFYLSSDINAHNSSDNSVFKADLCSNNCSVAPITISENFVSPAFLLKTKSKFLAFAESNAFPFNSVIGLAFPTTVKPNVELALPAANEHRILLQPKFRQKTCS